ncbi:MAG: BrnA antitoxin family protein [Terriglobales bacterium]
MKKVDGHAIRPEEYDELPEWTPDTFRRADALVGGKLVRRGRPKASVTKRLTSLRLSEKVLKHFRATGPGWQTRINEVLKKHVSRTSRRA